MRHLPMLAFVCLGVAAGPSAAGETYDLLFKSGALDDLVAASQSGSGDVGLEYDRKTLGTLDGPGSGTYRLDLHMLPPDDVELTLHQGEKRRGIGTFPASVGNPVIMYFMETTLARHGREIRRQPVLHPQPPEGISAARCRDRAGESAAWRRRGRCAPDHAAPLRAGRRARPDGPIRRSDLGGHGVRCGSGLVLFAGVHGTIRRRDSPTQVIPTASPFHPRRRTNNDPRGAGRRFARWSLPGLPWRRAWPTG